MDSTSLQTKVTLEPVNTYNLKKYIEIAIASYSQHYCHLWQNNDPSPYISHWLTESVIAEELQDPNSLNYIIYQNNEAVGILKLVNNCGIDEIPDTDALKAEKIYLLQEYSGKGIGRQLLQIIEDIARKLNRKVIWLDTMKKGNPIHFYQKNGYTIKRESEVILPFVKPSEKAMWILTKTL